MPLNDFNIIIKRISLAIFHNFPCHTFDCFLYYNSLNIFKYFRQFSPSHNHLNILYIVFVWFFCFSFDTYQLAHKICFQVHLYNFSSIFIYADIQLVVVYPQIEFQSQTKCRYVERRAKDLDWGGFNCVNMFCSPVKECVECISTFKYIQLLKMIMCLV